MKSSFLEKSKRALVLLLTGAMIATSVPSTAFAATVDADDEVIFEDTQDVVENNAAALEEEVVGEADPVEPDDYYQDVEMAILYEPATTHYALVSLAGDAITPYTESSVTGSIDGGVTAISNYGIDIDSDYGFTGYIVPEYGYTLPSDLSIVVTGQYEDATTTATTDISDSDWEKGTAVDLSYLDSFYGFEWSQAVPVTIKPSQFLKNYSAAAVSKKKKMPTIGVKGSAATANEVSLKVTVDGKEVKTGYRTEFDKDNTDAIALTTSIKPADIANYDYKVALVDAEGTTKVLFTENTYSNTDDTYGEVDMTGNEYGYYIGTTSTATNLYLTAYSIKKAYQAAKDNNYTLLVAFKKKAAVVEYDVIADENNFAKIKSGTKDITSTPGTVKVDGESDILFNVTTKNKVGSHIKSVKYLVQGSASAKNAIEYNSEKGVFKGEYYYTPATSPSDPAGESLYYYDESNDPYPWTAAVEHSPELGRKYYSRSGAKVASGTSGDYGIPYEIHQDISGSVETEKGNITLFVETYEDVTYKIPKDEANKSLVTVNDGSAIISVGDAVSGSEAATNGNEPSQGKKYTFTVSPKAGKVIDKVTVKMITDPESENMVDVTADKLVDNNFGSFTVKDITGAFEITIKTADENTETNVKLTSDSSANVTVKEKSTGKTVVAAPGVDAAADAQPFNFIVVPDAGHAISKVEYTMGNTVKTLTALEPVSSKANGNKEYSIPAVAGDISIKVTDEAAADIIKYPNDDVVLKVGAEEIADNGVIRAAKSADLTVTIEAKEGSTIDKVYYGENSKTQDSALSLGTVVLTSTGNSYTIGNSSIDDKTIYVVTKKTISDSKFKAVADVTFGSKKTDISKVDMYAGGKGIFADKAYTDSATSTIAKGVGAQADIDVTFLTPEGAAIGTASDFALGIAASSKTAVATIVKDSGVITTTNVAGTDTITANLEQKDSGHFPKIYVYSKELPLTTKALNTKFDKLELEGDVFENAALSGLTGTDSNTIRVDDTNIDDSITYVVYPYTTVDGKSTKNDLPLAGNTGIGKYQPISSIEWSVTPEVAPTVKDSEKDYVLSNGLNLDYLGSGYEAVYATIETAQKAQDLTVTATINFADGTTLSTNTATLTVADKLYGYIAIPTITVNDHEEYNSSYVNIETKTQKTATVKWDIYSVNNFAGLEKLTSGNTIELGRDSSTINATSNDIKGWVASGDITLVSDGIEFGDPVFDTKGIASATAGATSTVTAIKKGYDEFELNAKVNNMVVAAKPISVVVENELSGYTVEFYSGEDPLGSTDYSTKLGESGADSKYAYPTFLSTAAIKSAGGNLSEIVDDPTAGTKHSLGFALTDVKSGTVIELPSQEAAYDESTINPKVALYGWSVGGSVKKIGEKVQVFGDTFIEPLWAYKYQEGIRIYRYDGGVKGAIVGSAIDLVISDEANDKIYSVPIVAAYKELDVEKGPDGSGNPQYKDEVIATSGLTLTPTHSSALNKTALANNELREDVGLALAEPVTLKFTDGDAVYDSKASSLDPWEIEEPTISVTSNGTASEYTVTLADQTVEVGQTKTVAPTVKVGDDVKQWKDFVSVAVTLSDDKGEFLKAGAITVSGNTTNNINLTGIKTTSSDITLNLEATDSVGAKATATCKVKVVDATRKIVPTVSWTSADGLTTISDKQTTGTIYAKIGVDNTITWGVEDASGNAIATTNAFKSKNSTGNVKAISAGTDTGWGITGNLVANDSETDFSGAQSSRTVHPNKLGVGEITVQYTESATSMYEVAIPVVTYQSIEFVAPTTALKDVYAVKKGSTALAADKNGVEKIVYETGKVSYTFDSTPYTAEWTADSATKFDHYYWASNKTNAKTDGTLDTGATKAIDIGESLTKTKSEWEGISGGLKYYAAFGAKKLELSNIPDTITLSDETVSSSAANGTDVAVISMGVTPYDSANVVSVTGKDVDMYILARGDRSAKTTNGTAIDVVKANTWKPTSSYHQTDVPGVNDADPVSLTVDNTNGTTQTATKGATVTSGKSRTDTFTVAKVNDPLLSKQYVGTSTITVMANGGDYKEVTLYINGEYNTGKKDADGNDIIHYMKNGEDLVEGVVTVQGKKHYYKDGARVNDGVFNDNGKLILINAGAQVTTPGRTTYDAKSYYIGADGTIQTGLFTGTDGKQYLATAEGDMVTYKTTTDAGTPGIYTDASGAKYEIATDDTAKVADVLYNASVTWVEGFPAKVTKGTTAPVLKYTITYTSEKQSKSFTTDPISVTATTDGNFTASSTDTEITFTATPDLTGYFAADKTTPATAEPKTQKYMFKDGGLEGVAGSYTVKSSSFKWSDLGEGGTAPTVTLDLTYTVKQEGEADREEVLTAVLVTPVKETEDDTTVTYTATYATMDEAQPTLTETKKYSKATGKAGEYTYKTHTAFTWSTLGKDDTTPTASTKVTYSVTQDGKKVADESFTATATVTLVSSSDTRKTFKAEVTTIDGKKISEEKTYNIKKTDESGNASAMEGIVIEGLWDEYEYAGMAVQPAFTLVDYDVEDGVALAFGTDYTVKYTNNKAAGTGTITITGKGNYAGKNLTANFKIVDKFASLEDKTNLATSVKKITKITDAFFYDGTAKYPAQLSIDTSDGTLTYKYNEATGEYENQGTDAKDVVISVSNNIKAGSAVVSAQGASDKKPKTAKFKINALDLSAAGDKLEVTINGGENAAYAVKGAMPSVEAVYTNAAGDDITLIPGQDFKVTYKNNKAAGTATATLKGMKNCSKSVDKTFTIDPLDLSELDEEAVSVLALSGKKVSTIKVTITDEYGDVIPAKALNVSVYESGKETALDKKAAIPSEFDIKIEAGKADLKESISIEGLKPVTEFKAKIAVDKAFNKAGIAYTGTPIILTDIVDDKGDNLFENGKITVTVGGTKLTYGEDFEVAGYKNNNKKGKMSFTLRGINNYAGTKVGTVKIVAKTISKIETE